jgi:Phytanoyl-CoA dioxygenase (PhyH)
MARITTEHLSQLHTDGYVVVHDFMTDEERAEVDANLGRYFPTWDELVSEPEKWPNVDRTGDSVAELPFRGNALNHMSTHPELIAFSRAALGHDQVFLTQAICWAKYAGRADFEQSLHLDWHDNSLVVPRSDGAYGQLHMILYYSDVGPGMAPTTIVPREAAADRPLVPWARRKAADPELYERELPVHVRAGALLCFTDRTFHRCSGFTATEGARFTHHLAWRGTGHEWMSWRGWAQYADQLAMVRWLPRASVDQRTALGFPPPGHPYWNEETVALVGARYRGMIMAPYREAMAAR